MKPLRSNALPTILTAQSQGSASRDLALCGAGIVLTGIVAIDAVIGAHEGAGLTNLNANLKGKQIGLAHGGLNCLVAIELKVGRFEPEYLVKLSFYLEAFPLKSPVHSSCQGRDRAEWSFAFRMNGPGN